MPNFEQIALIVRSLSDHRAIAIYVTVAIAISLTALKILKVVLLLAIARIGRRIYQTNSIQRLLITLAAALIGDYDKVVITNDRIYLKKKSSRHSLSKRQRSRTRKSSALLNSILNKLKEKRKIDRSKL